MNSQYPKKIIQVYGFIRRITRVRVVTGVYYNNIHTYCYIGICVYLLSVIPRAEFGVRACDGKR